MTFEEAVDEINKMFLDAWSPTGYRVHWDAVRKKRDTSDNPFVFFTINHAGSAGQTLGGIGNISFQRAGIAIANIYVPTGNGLSESYRLAKTVLDAYEGKHSPSGVWFRNGRIREIGNDGEFHQVNTEIEFSYYETK